MNIERVRGADLGDDTLIGDATDNNLDGRAGDDARLAVKAMTS